MNIRLVLLPIELDPPTHTGLFLVFLLRLHLQHTVLQHGSGFQKRV
jgi:hypothetical protein